MDKKQERIIKLCKIVKDHSEKSLAEKGEISTWLLKRMLEGDNTVKQVSIDKFVENVKPIFD